MNHLLRGTIRELSSYEGAELVDKMLENSLSTEEHTESEKRSWENSLYRFIQLLYDNNLDHVYLIAEYQLSQSRIDVLLFGENIQKQKNIVVVELKQWSDLGENESNYNTLVNINPNSAFPPDYREHPVYQTNRYASLLNMHHSWLINNKHVSISAIQYLDNYDNEKDKFFIGNYSYLKKYYESLYIKDEEQKMVSYLCKVFGEEELNTGKKLAEKFSSGKFIIGEEGFNNLGEALKGNENYVLIEEQNEIALGFNLGMKNYKKNPQNLGVVIRGDAGTGKTVIGQYLIYLAIKKDFFSMEEVMFTFSKGTILREMVSQALDFKERFPFFNTLNSDEYQFIIVDEAHRMPNLYQTLDKKFFNRDKTSKNVIIVFLQDDRQIIRIDEEGTYEKISEYFKDRSITNRVYDLTTQKRAQNNSSYISKLRNLLFSENNVIKDDDETFQVELDLTLKEIDFELWSKVDEKSNVKSKWFAPYVWEWITKDSPKMKENDISITDHDGGIFEKKWNPLRNQVDWYNSYSMEGFNQVGSVYTAQGLGYDYIGFIWWDDLKWNPDQEKWEFDINKSEDYGFKKDVLKYLKEHNYSDDANNHVLQIILNQYYVLLSRASKGAYIWFKDQETKEKVATIMKN